MMRQYRGRYSAAFCYPLIALTGLVMWIGGVLLAHGLIGALP
jgi:hypothetical protein